MPSSDRSALIDITFIDAHLFLCESTGSRPSTRWVFLDQLAKACGVPLPACELVGDFSAAMYSITAEADSLRDAGMVGHHQELVSQIEHLREQRAECLQSSIRRSASRMKPSAVRLGPQGPSSSSSYDVAAVAAELKREHCCVIDEFVGADEAEPLRELLGSMRSSGALKPGEVSAGLQQQRRGDLMAWVSTEVGAQAPPLRALLHSIDLLVGALGQQKVVADDLGPQRMLCRHEMQVTCYPGNGARYVKHVDDPHGSRGRVLTLIAYSNSQWEPGHGGALRLHVPSGARDVEPRDRRLVLFWSDARAPHEVLHHQRSTVLRLLEQFGQSLAVGPGR